MLIEFRVKNFRCLRDEQILSMLPTKDKDMHETNTFKTGFKPVPELLNSAVIYGANASGKTTVLNALLAMRMIVLLSAKNNPEDELDVVPFLLDTDFAKQAIEFEISFIKDTIRYKYGFTCTKERILEEYLYVYENAKPQTWFTRHFNDETQAEKKDNNEYGADEYEYSFGSHLKGPKDFLKKATRSNALFLSMAVQLNNQQLRVVWFWFLKKLLVINEVQGAEKWLILPELRNSEEKRIAVCKFLQSADISIDSIEVKERKGFYETDELLKKNYDTYLDELKNLEAYFHHRTEKGNAKFGLQEESRGTKSLFYLLIPILDILERNGSIFVDELDNSLHTLLVKKLIYLFHTTGENASNAQLIFTTHDTSLLQDKSLFRRDQIWFTEKDEMQASSLYALAEFSPRKNEAIEKAYLQGRYGAIPFLTDWEA